MTSAKSILKFSTERKNIFIFCHSHSNVIKTHIFSHAIHIPSKCHFSLCRIPIHIPNNETQSKENLIKKRNNKERKEFNLTLKLTNMEYWDSPFHPSIQYILFNTASKLFDRHSKQKKERKKMTINKFLWSRNIYGIRKGKNEMNVIKNNIIL